MHALPASTNPFHCSFNPRTQRPPNKAFRLPSPPIVNSWCLTTLCGYLTCVRAMMEHSSNSGSSSDLACFHRPFRAGQVNIVNSEGRGGSSTKDQEEKTTDGANSLTKDEQCC
jgi:hypothetical protein